MSRTLDRSGCRCVYLRQEPPPRFNDNRPLKIPEECYRSAFLASWTSLVNRDGGFVEPGATGFSAALHHSSWTSRASYEELLPDQSGAASWPITAGTFILVPQQSHHPQATIATLKFFTWAFVHAEAAIGKTDFVQLPDKVQGRIFGDLTTVTDDAGVPLRRRWPTS